MEPCMASSARPSHKHLASHKLFQLQLGQVHKLWEQRRGIQGLVGGRMPRRAQEHQEASRAYYQVHKPNFIPKLCQYQLGTHPMGQPGAKHEQDETRLAALDPAGSQPQASPVRQGA
mmetsp:Transcript_42499/g.76204  ORF Transcript_42499/g.76204 Transcript_42499/m.76204 type:complete len:117 (+) Transcript_42499:106-456(+)